MSTGLEKTWGLLAQSRNRACLPLLAAGLESKSADLRVAAIRTIIRRHDRESQAQLIRRYASFGEPERQALREAHRAMPHHAAATLKAAVLQGDRVTCANACDMIVWCADFDLFPTLVKAAENRHHRHASVVIGAMLAMAHELQRQIAEATVAKKGERHDPAFTRHHLLTTLEHSLAQFDTHQRTEIIDALLLLAPLDNSTLLRILRDPRHACHAHIVSAMATSDDAAVIHRLVELLRDTDAPEAALTAISRRTDESFVTHLLQELKHPAPVRVLHNMKRMRRVAWLETNHDRILETSGRGQTVAVDLATASGMDRALVFRFLALILRDGLSEGRRAACQALVAFPGSEADELLARAVRDPDAGVQAAALRQLRGRKLPDALQHLVARLDSPSAEVRDAARSSLAEFNFIRYRAMFDLLDDEAQRTTGALVYKVDNSACDRLIEELTSPSVTSRIRGIEMAVAMQASQDVVEVLIELSVHENVAVREEAVAALGHCHGTRAVEALEEAARDSNRSVAEAAAHSLNRLKTIAGTEKSQGAAASRKLR
jgi:HEAT repeat protein